MISEYLAKCEAYGKTALAMMWTHSWLALGLIKEWVRWKGFKSL